MKIIRITKPGRLLLAAVTLMMLLSTAAMAKTITLKYYKSDRVYAAKYTAARDENLYFKMPVMYSGLIDVTGGYETPSGYEDGISVTMYNSKGYRLDYNTSNYVNYNNEDSYERYAVTPGNYYFRVKARKGNTYIFGAGYVPKVLSNPKGGAFKAGAYTLARNRSVSGVISAWTYKAQKWFKFYVPKQSRGVKIRVLVSGGQGPTNVYIAGPNLSSARKMTIYAQKGYSKWEDLDMYTQVYDTRSYKTGPKPGWYYVLVTKGTGSQKYASSRFSVRWSYFNF